MDSLRILPLRQAKYLKFSPARFARRQGFTKVPLRILPLRQAKTQNLRRRASRAGMDLLRIY